MIIRFAILLLLPFLFITSCKKDDFVYIEGNVAPPDSTIEEVTIRNYVNKAYISLLGRKATDVEYEAGLTILENGNADSTARGLLIDEIMNKDEYFHNEFETARENVLNNADTSDFTFFTQIFINAKTTTNDSVLIGWYDLAIERLELLQQVIPDLENDLIDFPEVHKRCIYNNIYDDINMGTENFVVSVYQNFLLRYPTTDELSQASKVVDGSEAIVFYEVGRSKEDFIDIFLSSDEYFEGQVRLNYLRFLYREPTTEELANATLTYKSNIDFKLMQKNILISDEYFGI